VSRIDSSLLAGLPLSAIRQVIFYKLDELTTDLICCEVEADGEKWTFHEDTEGWDLLIRHLEGLEGFRQDWFAAVAQPPFARSETVAFRRP
jgi:hypothetical protein